MKIIIDRSKPLDIGDLTSNKLWSIDEQDERSTSLTEISLSDISLKTVLNDGEKSIKGEDKLSRLKGMGYICLDAGVLKTLWENQHLIPLEWREIKDNFVTFVFFDGTIFKNPKGDRSVLCLYWGKNKWNCNPLELSYRWSASFPSAVLEKKLDL